MQPVVGAVDRDEVGGAVLRHGGADWWLSTPSLLPQVRRYVDRKAIPQIQELIRKYDPDILWFDTPHKLPAEENLRILKAVREARPDIVVNGASRSRDPSNAACHCSRGVDVIPTH